jgi:hypothetical protein
LTRFFLTVCIDQVDFMESRVQPNRPCTRILLWAEEEIRLGLLPPKPTAFCKPCFTAENCRAATLTPSLAPVNGRPGESSRRWRKGVPASESSRAPLRLAFPDTLAAR